MESTATSSRHVFVDDAFEKCSLWTVSEACPAPRQCLSEHLFSVADVSGFDGLHPGLALLVLFQELLRRYNREEVVYARFEHQEESTNATIALSGNPSIRDAVAAAKSILGTAAKADRVVAHFSFTRSGAPLKVESAPGCAMSLSIALDAQCVVHGRLSYDQSLYRAQIARGICDHFGHLLFTALGAPDTPLSELPVLTETDVAALSSWNQTTRSYPNLTVDRLFRIKAAEIPDKIAAVFAETSITYAQLASRASYLAAHLRAVGVAVGDSVAVYLQRSLDVPVALLGVLEAGAVFVPVDASFPTDRIAFMLNDGQVKAVVTQTELLNQLSAVDSAIVCLDQMLPNSGDNLTASMAGHTTMSDLAYVLYTSGSTGKPKGVEIRHGALTNLLVETTRQVSLGPDDVVLAIASLSFDISSFEILAPLISGARLVIVPRSVTTDGVRFGEMIEREGGTLIQATPSGWRILIETGWKGRSDLKLMTCAEPLDRSLANELLDRSRTLWNLYGPTETTVYSNMTEVRRDDEYINVGRPLANYKNYVLDRSGKQLPPGAIGELYVGGSGLARGYRNLPALTAARFVRDPFSGSPDAAMYGSGDLARLLDNGEVEILGRIDNQIKIRGYRIELEEIERILGESKSVSRVVAKLVDFGDGDARLVAFVVPSRKGDADEFELRGHAAAALPSYMVPSAFYLIQSVPLTPTGKVDRNALQPPQLREEIYGRDGNASAPRNEVERFMLKAWRDILRVPDLGLDDDFFDSGGHSLLAARLFAQLSDKFQVKLPVTLLLNARTARRLAAVLTSRGGERQKNLIPLHSGGPLPPLYLVHHLLGDAMLYRHIARCFIGAGRPIVGIQACAEVMTDPKYRTIEKLAAVYISEILEQQRTGPFHLAGYSSGGIIAFEMARQFAAMGHHVGITAMVDATVNSSQAKLPKGTHLSKQVIEKCCRVAFKLSYELRQSPTELFTKRMRGLVLSSKVRKLERLHKKCADTRLTMEEALMLAERAFRPGTYMGEGLLIRYDDEARRYGPDPLMGWGPIFQCNNLKVVDLPGNHVSGLFPPHVSSLAALLSTQMQQVEGLANSSRAAAATA